MASPTDPRPPSPSPSQLPPIPGSPTYSYASTANRLSAYNLPLPPPPRPVHAVLTKTDLEQSQLSYGDLLASAKTYRVALAALSTAASAFGSALESCARLKEARADTLGPPGGASLTNSFTNKGTCTADLLLGASGVHHLIANHQQILSETVYRSFEVPLLHELDKWRAAVDDEDETYKRDVAARSKEIRRMEKEGLKLHRQRRRDVGKFREHLVELTQRLDGLTTLHADHARTLLRESQDTSEKIVDASSSLVRAEVDIFESLARKGWTGGGLDDLLDKGRDLFAADDESAGGGVVSGAGDGTKLFSILPPKSILADSASDSGVRPRAHGRADSLLVDNDRYQSLAGAVVDRGRPGGGDDADSFFSEFNHSRGVRPFSPQPIRRQATDVILDPEALPGDVEGGGARDASAQGLGLDEDEVDDEAVSPWRDEGAVKKDEEDPSGEPNATANATTTTTSHSRDPDAAAKGRERRWSVTEEEGQ